MNTIDAILHPDPDGTLHLPLPLELRRRAVKIVATLEPAEETVAALPPSDSGTVLDALLELRKLGGLRHVIADGATWQREQREDRALPGRG